MVQLKTLVALGAIVGGLCWIAKFFAERSDAAGGLLDVFLWAGLALMTIAFVGAGVSLVRIGNHWLEAVVGVATPALVWSVEWAFKGGDADTYAVDGIFGALVVGYGVVMYLRARRRPDRPQQDVVPRRDNGKPGRRRAKT